VASGYVPSVIEADIDFHLFVYEASGNPLIGETAQPHWQHLRRVMAAALSEEDLRISVWDEHEGILRALQQFGGRRGRGALPRPCRADGRHPDGTIEGRDFPRRLKTALSTKQDDKAKEESP
jgi:DNA-binding GntR family transcriptional regulator